MPVIVLLSEAVRGESTRGAPRPDERITQALRERGVALRPMHPDSPDPKLSRYQAIDVADRRAAEDLIEALGSLPGIEAAYWKPADEAP